MQITGQCHCGAISFTARIDPDRVLVCHCSDCQRLSGAPFRAVLPVPRQDVDLRGEPRLYVKTAASGNRRAQAFCGTCGASLYATEADTPTTLNLRLGCIDQRDQLTPQRQIWTQSAQPWIGQLDRLPAHRQGSQSPQVAAPGTD